MNDITVERIRERWPNNYGSRKPAVDSIISSQEVILLDGDFIEQIVVVFSGNCEKWTLYLFEDGSVMDFDIENINKSLYENAFSSKDMLITELASKSNNELKPTKLKREIKRRIILD